jgi:methionyl-tRNA formyltransferase
MRLVMLGTGPFAVPTLKSLAASPHEVVHVITRPPRGRVAEVSPMHRAAVSLGVLVWSPESVNLPESQGRLKSLSPDLLVVCDYGEILKSETLATTRLGGINLHGSLLPKYRGAAPVQSAILHGDAETGNSVIQMTAGLDAGPCLGQQRTPIDPEEDAAALEARLAQMGAELVLRIVEQLATVTTTPITQDTAAASKAPRFKKEQGAIDWSRSAIEIKNLVRAVQPWPRAYTFWHRQDAPLLRLSIDRVQARAASAARDGIEPVEAAAPGTVTRSDQQLIVATGNGLLELVELQPAGKRSMPANEFLRGNRVQVGDRFGPE